MGLLLNFLQCSLDLNAGADGRAGLVRALHLRLRHSLSLDTYDTFSLCRAAGVTAAPFLEEKRTVSHWREILFFLKKKNMPEGSFLSRMSNKFIKTEAPSTTHSQCSFSLFYLLCHIFVFHVLELRCISLLVMVFLVFSDLIETCTNAHWSVLWGDKAVLMYHTSENCKSTQPSPTSCLSLSSNKQQVFGDTGPVSSRGLPHYRGHLGRTGEKQMRTDWLQSTRGGLRLKRWIQQEEWGHISHLESTKVESSQISLRDTQKRR